MKIFWYTNCPNCNNQGNLNIMKNQTTSELYLHCDECEWGWRDPTKILNSDAMFMTLLEDFHSVPATWDEIVSSNWQIFARNASIE